MALFRQPSPSQPVIEVRGAKTSIAGDWYHFMLRAPWWVDLLAIAAGFLFVNVVFACAYLEIGGIFGAHTFSDLFFFSVQTMGTIGYGSMYPQTFGAHVLTTGEAIVGIFVIAVSTGLVFSKFSVLRARVRFASRLVITPMNGVPTLMIRLGHERSSSVIDALIRVVLTRTEHTSEGVLMYRMYDLVLERDWAPALNRAWTVMHTITSQSPLFGATPESFKAEEFEFTVCLRGVDETSGQTLHARRTYEDAHVSWGARYGDMLSERPQGGFLVDMNKFDETVVTEPTASFAYPKGAEALLSAAPLRPVGG
ncbi:MAG TPA: ion channel [Polyangiaceae bacterium]|nr:ion channel [Polyangiaceae bacterium]